MTTTLEGGEKQKTSKGFIDTDKVVGVPLKW